MPDLRFEDRLTDNVKTLWSTRISNLSALKEHLAGVVLVAFDTVGVSREFARNKNTSHVSELGFSALCTDIATSTLGFNGKDFTEANNTRNLAIQLLQRPERIERTTTPVLYAQATEVEGLVHAFFTDLPGRRILVTYDARQELKWINSTLPSLVDKFDAMVDVQELVDQRFLQDRDTKTRPHERLGLRSALIVMRFSKTGTTTTRAVNDCSRILQVLGGLVQSKPFHLPEARPRFPHYEHLPRPGMRYQFALRIRASDGQRLPRWTPADVVAAFRHHEGLRGVGLNWKHARTRQEGPRVWWLWFWDYRTMHRFCESMDGQTIEGVKIRVVPDFEETDVCEQICSPA